MVGRKLSLSFIICLICLILISGCEFIQSAPDEEEIPENPDNIVKQEAAPPNEEPIVESPELGDGSEKEHRELTPEAIVKIYGDTIFRFKKDSERIIALTFDDGPDANFTPKILDVLKKHEVPATFFIIGVNAEKNPDNLKRITIEGHDIGQHGYNHYKMSNLTPEEINAELDKVNILLKEQTGKSTNIFRPPYGAIDPELVETVKARGDYIILWDIDSLDWRGLDKNQILKNILPEVHPGAIILQHSAGGPGEDLTGTIEALDELIPELQTAGYQFVTISQMFESKMVNNQK